MSRIFPVTAQMVVKNEERFVWYAVSAVLPFVERFLITDTGSTDKTWEILQTIKSKKILLKRKRKSVVTIRQEQLKQTETPWFLLVDGDEIWPKQQLSKLLQLTKEVPREKVGVVNRTKNCVGDVWHYLPESAGKYRFGKWQGHLNIRLMRTLPYEIVGSYPWEEYRIEDQSVNDLTDKLAFSSAWYLHASHLKRTSIAKPTSGRRQQIVEKGIRFSQKQLPQILFEPPPAAVMNPLANRGFGYELAAAIISPFKWLKRTIYG